MKKKNIVIVLAVVIMIIGGLFFFLFKERNVIIEESYIDVVINSSNTAEVFSDHKVSEYISVIGGNILNDASLDTSVTGKQKNEVIYINKEKKKYKAYLEIDVVDSVAPLILGGSSYTLKKANNQDLSFAFFSADNYDNDPKREIIGTYDINTIGQYELTLKVSDASQNISSKNFTLKVVESITPAKPVKTETLYSDVINAQKNDTTAIGIDVSRWQEDIDYEIIKANGVEFVMMRVGFQEGFDGSSVLDSYFIQNITRAKASNIPVGLYYYSYATSTKEAKEQALWVIDQIKKYDITLPIAFDWESWSKFVSLKLSLHDINEIAEVFINTINEHGYVGMNYSSKYYLENIWNLEDFPTWLAHYTKQTSYTKEYLLWQLCNDGVIPGINGAVDINVMNKNSVWYNQKG